MRDILKPVDVPKFMNALISDLQSDAWDRDVKLVLDASTAMIADFDLEQCHASLRSLLAGLIGASSPNGSITVVTSFEPHAPGTSQGSLQITITAAAVRPQGLGAAAQPLKIFVSDHDGQLSVASDGGSWTCLVTLPGTRYVDEAPLSRVAIVVDDDVDMQDFLTAVLESRGFKVIAVNDGFDALIVIDRYQPDVVLTDVLMPNMNGIDLVGRIKQARADLPVIVFSGYYDSLVKKSAELGSLPDYILPKPMTQLQVITAIDTVLAKAPPRT